MNLKEFFDRDHYAALSGIELLEIREGYARARMVIRPEIHYNGVDVVQGGAVFTLADLTFAAASNSHGTVALAINVSISFLKASTVADGTLIAEAREISRSKKLGSYTVDVTNERGERVAIFQGMVYRKEETVDQVLARHPR